MWRFWNNVDTPVKSMLSDFSAMDPWLQQVDWMLLGVYGI